MVRDVLLTVLIGIVAGILDILPMIKMKLDRYSIVSAFIHYLIVPFFIFSTELFGMAWWLKGGVINLVLVIPVIILAAKYDIKSVPPMVITSIVLGTAIGVAGHFILY